MLPKVVSGDVNSMLSLKHCSARKQFCDNLIKVRLKVAVFVWGKEREQRQSSAFSRDLGGPFPL